MELNVLHSCVAAQRGPIMMMNLRANYFLLIPSVLAIIVVSFVHPFPYTETKSWIHHQQNFDVVLESENNRNNKVHVILLWIVM